MSARGGDVHCVVPVHAFPVLVTPTAHLLQRQWGLSIEFRESQLERSCAQLPTHWALLRLHRTAPASPSPCHARLPPHPPLPWTGAGAQSDVVGAGTGAEVDVGVEVIGHALVERFGAEPRFGMALSVLVGGDHRGKGYGRVLMDFAEAEAARQGVERMYLFTSNKAAFYQACGYALTHPIPDWKLKAPLRPRNEEPQQSQSGAARPSGPQPGLALAAAPPPPLAPPPPPPPPPPSANSSHGDVWLFKDLAL